MLIPRQARRQTGRWQGSPRVGLSGLRRHLVSPSELPDGHRQRLLELAQRLSRVQALGDEYFRVELSPHAAKAVAQTRHGQDARATREPQVA